MSAWEFLRIVYSKNLLRSVYLWGWLRGGVEDIGIVVCVRQVVGVPEAVGHWGLLGVGSAMGDACSVPVG